MPTDLPEKTTAEAILNSPSLWAAAIEVDAVAKGADDFCGGPQFQIILGGKLGDQRSVRVGIRGQVAVTS